MSSNHKAAPISAKDFVEAYVNTHKADGTIADLAEKLDRSVEQVRAKKNSLFANLRKQGVNLPSLKRQERDGSAYTEAVELGMAYMAEVNADIVSDDDTSEE